jgi:hypothetical protein
MSRHELDEVRNHAHWDEEKEDWAMPNFDFHDKGSPPPRSSNQRSSYELRVNRSSAAVSPQPRDIEERSGRDFKIKHSGQPSKDQQPAYRAPSNTKLDRMNFDNDIFDGRKGIKQTVQVQRTARSIELAAMCRVRH